MAKNVFEEAVTAPKAGTPDAQLTFEFALAAYQDARGEILKRLEFREKIVEIYVVGSIAFLAGLASFNGLFAPDPSQPSLPLYLYLLSPLFSLITSIQLMAHIQSTEKLAQHIRWEVNPVLVLTGGWAPYWDWSSRQTDSKGGMTDRAKKTKRAKMTERAKTIGKFLSQFVSIHLPSFVCLVLYFFNLPSGAICSFSRDGNLFLGGGVVFCLAIWATWLGYAERFETMKHGVVPSPEWWKSPDWRTPKPVPVPLKDD